MDTEGEKQQKTLTWIGFFSPNTPLQSSIKKLSRGLLDRWRWWKLLDRYWPRPTFCSPFFFTWPFNSSRHSTSLLFFPLHFLFYFLYYSRCVFLSAAASAYNWKGGKETFRIFFFDDLGRLLFALLTIYHMLSTAVGGGLLGCDEWQKLSDGSTRKSLPATLLGIVSWWTRGAWN